MKRIYILFSLIFMTSMLIAQVRYVDPMFDVNVESDITYATNVSILTGVPLAIELKMDVYTPAEDSETERPLILVSHTGSFLPQLFNGQVTGGKTDSASVYTCMELARRGYVAVSYTYRLGWLPTSPEEDARRGTLLQAAYRGIQDSRACVRFFRRDAAENNNQFGIDSERIGMIGIGTGGYLALGCGSLYDFADITLDKFIDMRTALPYVDTLVFGNIFGTDTAAINIPNHPGFSSEIGFSFNMGGALGDETWISGTDNEAAFAGVHATGDIFAPYAVGPVIVPTTNEFVVNVAGTRAAIEQANVAGNNDIFNNILPNEFTDLVEAQKETDLTLFNGQTLKLGTDNFYGLVTPFSQGTPWEWWDKATLDLVVQGTNMALMTEFNSDTLHRDGLLTNPDMSAEKGKTYLDTIITFMIPRSCAALNLNCEGITSVEEELIDHNITIQPNPAIDKITFRSDNALIRSVLVFDIKGQLVEEHNNIDNISHTVHRNQLPNGIYIAQLRFDDGNQTMKFSFK